MKTTPIILTIVVLSIFPGCGLIAENKEPLSDGKELFTVDFQNGQTLRYKFVSSRDIIVDWDPTGKMSKSGKSTPNKSSESMEIIIAYTPIKIDPYGLTTIQANCETVKVARSRGPRTDAVEHLAGKTFTFTVGPAGKVEDYSQLDGLIREIGKKAFRENTRSGRIKEPDMICDFVATQWFLWDSVSSIEEPFKGVKVGHSWRSKLSIPAPMVMRKARDVTYKLDKIHRSEKGRLAVISSSYKPAESVPHDWPIPYSGKFQMSGTFGFLSGYKLLSLEGSGQELFNIDAGRMEQYNQQYQMELQAVIPLGIGANPKITIKQNLTMKLLED